jgi:hypothetical protein
VYTDGWYAYIGVCKNLGLNHKSVNHKKHFRDPFIGVHTNTVEESNSGIKALKQAKKDNKKG